MFQPLFFYPFLFSDNSRSRHSKHRRPSVRRRPSRKTDTRSLSLDDSMDRRLTADAQQPPQVIEVPVGECGALVFFHSFFSFSGCEWHHDHHGDCGSARERPSRSGPHPRSSRLSVRSSGRPTGGIGDCRPLISFEKRINECRRFIFLHET